MESKTNNKLAIIPIIASLIAVSVFATILTMQQSVRDCAPGEKYEDGACVEILTPAEDIIDVTLNSNSYFQDSVGVGSTFTNLYYFKDDNTFKYSSKSNVKENDQVLLASGTWKYSNGKLVLEVTKKTIAKNGTIVDDVVTGKTLTAYEEETTAVKETKTYNVRSSFDDNIEYITGDITLYKVNLSKEEINTYFK